MKINKTSFHAGHGKLAFYDPNTGTISGPTPLEPFSGLKTETDASSVVSFAPVGSMTFSMSDEAVASFVPTVTPALALALYIEGTKGKAKIVIDDAEGFAAGKVVEADFYFSPLGDIEVWTFIKRDRFQMTVKTTGEIK